MADKKRDTLEDVVDRNTQYQMPPQRTRAREYLGGTITPKQWPQWDSHNKAARAADIEDLDDHLATSGRNMDRRVSRYNSGGMVKAGSPKVTAQCCDTKTIKR